MIRDLNIVFGLFGVILFVLSIQFKKKKDILLFQEIASLSYSVQYCLIGTYSAAVMDLISAGRCYIFRHHLKRKNCIPFKYLLIFVLLILILGIITFDGFVSTIPVIITLAYFISSYIKDIKALKIIFLLCGIGWFVYNLYVGVYICLIGNIGEIISGSIALYKLTKK